MEHESTQNKVKMGPMNQIGLNFDYNPKYYIK